jgi:N-acetylmuramoyl-L-alanine amidase
MRTITHLVVHCTATPHNTKIANIRRYWKQALGWKSVGYHKIIEADGNIVQLAPDSAVTNGVRGHNATSLHVSYIGGKDKDDRTIGQRKAIAGVLLEWLRKYPTARICGHRDFPNVNKACPQFSAEKEYGYLYITAAELVKPVANSEGSERL